MLLLMVSILAVVLVLLAISRLRSSNGERFAAKARGNGASCRASRCGECQSGCCHNGVCQDTAVCFGDNSRWGAIRLEDGVSLTGCLGGSNSSQMAVPVSAPAPVQALPAPVQQAQQGGGGGGGEWRTGTLSFYNLGSYEQNDGWPGCTKCQGCFNGTDDSWLVAVSNKSFASLNPCGRNIRIERLDNGQGVTVPIQDTMMAGDRNPYDIDATPAVARALGFNATVAGFGPNKPIRWRFV